MTSAPSSRERTLRRRGFILEFVTLGWNVGGVAVLTVLAISSTSVAVDRKSVV